jgi:transcriptional regulator with XRE-family HTH domain
LTRQKKTSPTLETFGAYIKRLRLENKLTLTQLAARLNMDSANLSKVENEKRSFDERKLHLLAQAFQLDLEQIEIEYYSDKIAFELYGEKNSDQVLELVRQKIKIIRQKKQIQDEIKFA